jgi:mRNA interferase RelE/StbE
VNSSYKLSFSKESIKELNKMEKSKAAKIVKAIENLSNKPYGHSQTKKMKGYEGDFYRLRVGDYRIIYEVIENQLLIVIVRIGARGGIYK